MSLLSKTTQILFNYKIAVIFTIIATGIWAYLWVGTAKQLAGGQNTAPIYLRIEFRESQTAPVDLEELLIARSATSGQPVSPEFVSGSSNVIRWRWVLLDLIEFAPSTVQNIVGIRSIEYAFDTSCDNEHESLPTSLQWKQLDLESGAGSNLPRIKNVPILNKSILPAAPVRRAINWCGDTKLVFKSVPSGIFPYVPFLFVFCVLFAYREFKTFVYAIKIPGVSEKSSKHCERPLTLSFLRGESYSYWPSYAAFLMFLIACAYGTPVFDVNDDQKIISLLAGHWGFEPSGRGLFMNSVLAFPLSSAYQFFPQVPWYGLFLLICAFLAVSIVGVCLAHFSGPRVHFAIFSAFLVSCAFLPIVRTTFTLVAILAASSAFVGIFTVAHWRILSRGENSTLTDSLLWLSLGILVIGAFIRLNAFLLVVAIAIPLGTFLIMRCHEFCGTRTFLFRLRGPFAGTCLCLVIILVGLLIDSLAYRSSPDWDSWRDQHAVMVDVVDQGGSALRRGLATEDPTSLVEDWTNLELQMISSSYLLEPELRSPDRLLAVVQGLQEFESAREKTPVHWILSTNRALFSIWVQPENIGTARLVLSFIGLMLLFLLIRGRGSNASLFAFTITWCLLLLVAVSFLFKDVPYRLTCGVFFFVAAVGAIILSSDLEDLAPQPSWFHFTFITMLLPIVLYQLVWHFNAWKARKERALHYTNEMELIVGVDEPIILTHMPNNAKPVLSTLKGHEDLPVIPVAYLALTPTAADAREKWQTFGLIDLLKSNKHALVLIANPENVIFGVGPTLKLLENYAEDKLGTDIQVNVLNEGFHWRWLELKVVASTEPHLNH